MVPSSVPTGSALSRPPPTGPQSQGSSSRGPPPGPGPGHPPMSGPYGHASMQHHQQQPPSHGHPNQSHGHAPHGHVGGHGHNPHGVNHSQHTLGHPHGHGHASHNSHGVHGGSHHSQHGSSLGHNPNHGVNHGHGHPHGHTMNRHSSNSSSSHPAPPSSYPPMQPQSNGDRSLPSAPPGSAAGPGPSSSSSHGGSGGHAHSHSHGSMTNPNTGNGGPTSSPYHRPLHSPPVSRQSQPGPGSSHGHSTHHPSHHHQSIPPPSHSHHPHHPHHSMHPPHHHPSMSSHYNPHYPHHSSHHIMGPGPPLHHPKGYPPPPSGAPAGGVSSSQQSKQKYLNNDINGNWQSDEDMSHRREMIQNIVTLLKQRDKNASKEWLDKLPQMVKQLEVSLYRSAESFEAYADKSTLKHRLQVLAMEIAAKTEDGGDSRKKSDDKGGPVTGPGSLGVRSMPGPPRSQLGQEMNGRPPPQARQPSSSGNRGVGVHMNGSMGDMMRNGGNRGMSTPALNSASSSGTGRNGAGGSISSAPSDSKTSDSRERTKKQQHRLLLLHHSSKCKVPDGKCSGGAACQEMKRLWAHMAVCEDVRCQVQHCYSSRSILSHYRKCKDQQCQVCMPVRQSVWSGKEKGSRQSSSSNGALSSGSHEPSGPPPPTSYDNSRPPALPTPTSSTSNQFPPSSQYPSYPASQNPSRTSSGGQSQPPIPIGYQSGSSSRPKKTSSSTPARSQGSGSRGPMEPSSSGRNGVSSSNGKDKGIIHKQQRLLLLRHASKCEAEDGKCPVTPHCYNMKRLWKHISQCSKKDCSVPHCISSRLVLMHYRKCKDAKCPSCAPVRAIIRNGGEKAAVADKKRPKTVGITDQGAQPFKRRRNDIEIKKEERVLPKPPTQPKKEEVSNSLLTNFTVEQIELHINSLNRTTQLPKKVVKENCMKVLDTLINHNDGWVFNTPVDPVELGIPDYLEKIKKPMDLGTIKKRLEKESYHTIEAFDFDVRLTFDNAMSYNEADSVVYEMAKRLMELYKEKHQHLTDQLKKEEEQRRLNDRACTLCGCEQLTFEPPVFFCSGMNCQSKRIHRNRHYYVAGNNQYIWCNACYSDLDDKTPIVLQDMMLKKEELKKKKNNEEHIEHWVMCDICEKWVHQICGLFNSRQNKDRESKYSCPTCLLKERKEAKKPPPRSTHPTAEDLSRTKLSECLESHVATKVNDKLRELAKVKAQVDKISIEDAMKAVDPGGKITIRQVTSQEKKAEVREKMKARYAHKNYPKEFPYRSKCILVFQNLDGVDVLLFALYLYEHGENNPAPNHRSLYISYLDSVHFMRPRNMRTFVYHEILIAYLDDARKRNFATAHIWACPPLKGDDYIFYAKPEDQKTPKDSRLRQWYIDMLIECQKRGIVGKLTNMHDLYFASGDLDATVVPYLEGDYFSGEVENVIKNVEQGTNGKGSSKAKSSKKKKGKVDKTKKMRKGTRSGGLDDDFITGDEGLVNDSTKDPVMVELGNFIKPMKESFIVAYLTCKGAKPEHKEVPQEILDERERRRLEEANKMSDESIVKSEDVTHDRKGNRIQVIDDDKEEIECEILNTRQDFLTLCRGNNYQFDNPRRAKHTSMMVLWHLHNRDAAKIVQMCAACGKDILSGVRYSCPVCPEFDLCPDCYKNPNTNRGACTHTLEQKTVDGESNQGSGNSNQLTEAQRNERTRNLKLHIQLLEHASRCNSAACNSSNCKKMKEYLAHNKTCQQKVAGGCKICKRIWNLLRYHATNCKKENCSIPQCHAIRERIRLLAKQQQAMDDRRRQEMNRQYRMGHTAN